jgi:hypothetical protein
MIALVLMLLSPRTTLANLDFECDEVPCAFSASDTMDVYLTIDESVTDLRGFSLNIQIESDVLRLATVERSDLLLGSCGWAVFSDVTTDSVTVDGAGLGTGCEVAGPGRLLRLRFVGASEGSSPVRCRTHSLRDSNNATITSACSQTTVTYRVTVPVIRATWSSIKGMYR